jgi:hypothetical protein
MSLFFHGLSGCATHSFLFKHRCRLQYYAVTLQGYLEREELATTKTATLTFRIDPGLKEALRAAAQQEHRSIANMVEVLILGYCKQYGITIANPYEN